MAKKRLDKNSLTETVNGFQGSIASVPIPEGVALHTEEEVIIWEQLTRARAREDWRDVDLLVVAKIVKTESDMRKHQETLDKSGVLIKNNKNALVANPLIAVIDTLQRQQLSLIRSISLNQQASDPRTLNGRAAGNNANRDFINKQGVEGLLAMPLN